jgi:hypothetical protein
MIWNKMVEQKVENLLDDMRVGRLVLFVNFLLVSSEDAIERPGRKNGQAL